jgi:hypothetical protein
MKIYSTDKSKFFELIFNNCDDLPFYQVIVDFGDFKGTNDSVYLENIEDFISLLDKYITDRNIVATLKGTYDFELTFYTKSGTTFVKINIGNTVCSPGGNEDFGVYGEFSIDQEYLNAYIQDLRTIQRNHKVI